MMGVEPGGLRRAAPRAAAGRPRVPAVQVHQGQRRGAGLPPERGWHAAGSLWGLCFGPEGVPLAVIAYGVLAFAWDLSTLLAGGCV